MIDENEFFEKLEKASLDILLPLRSSKIINNSGVNEMNKMLDIINKKYKGEEMIPKKIIGILISLFASMITEASYAKQPDDINKVAWEFEEKLEKILEMNY